MVLGTEAVLTLRLHEKGHLREPNRLLSGSMAGKPCHRATFPPHRLTVPRITLIMRRSPSVACGEKIMARCASMKSATHSLYRLRHQSIESFSRQPLIRRIETQKSALMSWSSQNCRNSPWRTPENRSLTRSSMSAVAEPPRAVRSLGSSSAVTEVANSYSRTPAQRTVTSRPGPDPQWQCHRPSAATATPSVCCRQPSLRYTARCLPPTQSTPAAGLSLVRRGAVVARSASRDPPPLRPPALRDRPSHRGTLPHREPHYGRHMPHQERLDQQIATVPAKMIVIWRPKTVCRAATRH